MEGRNLRAAQVLFAAALLPLCSGCARFMNFHSVERKDHGYTLVLNGIEGPHIGHANLVAGLKSGGVPSEIEVYDWTTGTPALMLVHLRYDSRNRRKAQEIADKIVAYQDEYPGRPVNLVGHSGGGGMALLALEALPPERKIDSAILLAAAISPDYDLRPVLPKLERGIWNYSSSVGDSALLVAGTTLAGTIDGRHGLAAGAIGFRPPADATADDRRLYDQKLTEVPYSPRMALNGNLSDHYGCMNFFFARNELAPLLIPKERFQFTHSLDELLTTGQGPLERSQHE